MMTISRRLLLLLLPTLAILMLVGGVADYLIAAGMTRNADDRALASSGLALAAYLRTEDGRLVFALPVANGSMVAARFDGALYSIEGPHGELIAGNAPLPTGQVRTNFGDVRFTDGRWQGRQLRIATLMSQTPLGPVVISVAETLERRLRAERVMLLGKLMIDFAELDLTLLVIWVGVYYGLRPLGRLRDQVERISAKQLQRLNESEVPGELRPMVLAFNHLLERLQDAALSQRRFVADAAHQLRTPVAGLMAQLDILLREPAAAPQGSELARINRGIQQLAHTANQLLTLARADPAAAVSEGFQQIELLALVQQLLERNIDRAQKAGLDLGAEVQPAQVDGDAWLLEDLLGNLIDNALKYTPSGGHVTVRCGVDAGSAFLEVEDDGPGIPEAERQRVRERFYRRADSVAPGCGLGLAIVDEIAAAHRARLVIDAAPDGQGARMRVNFASA